MSNSRLVEYKNWSPNCTKPRRGRIKNIIIHHMAGVLTVEQCGAIFARESRQASSHYGVDSSGRIGQYVDEKNRAWTTGAPIDHESVTIEVSNLKAGEPWEVSDKALAATIRLCVDICKRNDIRELYYTGDKRGNLLMHRWFQATGCPGTYLASKFPYIADEVNKGLSVAVPWTPDPSIEVDGWWGKATTKLAQHVLGTFEDGIVSRQAAANQKHLPAATSGWEWVKSPGKGSPMVRALQKLIGAEADGIFGPQTATKLQAYLGIKVSGKLDKRTVKSFQTWLNKKGATK